jgi:predicted nucleotidyltransferase
MKTKEDQIIRLFFEEPTREWHFEEILKEANIARSKADRWLKRFAREGLIKRIKEKRKMPFYISNYAAPSYKNKKRIFALKNFYESGLLDHLGSLKKARAVILFGSFSRSDWYRNSDIDLFIYGDPEGLKIADYEMKLHKNIQLFICRDKEELAKMGLGLIKSIVKGNIIKGDLDFVKVSVNA